MALSFFWTFSYSDLTTFRNQITYKFDFFLFCAKDTQI
jgi:hypothetical protein